MSEELEAGKRKPGYQTSELYGTAAIALVLQEVLTTATEPMVQAAACIGLALVGSVYTWSRVRSKV